MDKDAWRLISWDQARHQPLPEVDFCLTNFLAGSVGIVAAQAGIGKTSLLLQIGAAVAAGVPIAGDLLPPPQATGKVVFLATEDPPEVLQRRAHFLIRSLEHQGYGEETLRCLEERLSFYSLRSKLPILMSKGALNEPDLDRINMLAMESRLLILDPIRRFHHCDEQDYSQMSLLFSLLNDIAVQSGCSILFSHHVPQPESAADQDDPAGALGTSAFINATRWVLNLTDMSQREAEHLGIGAEDRRDYVRASFTKANYGPPLAPRWLRRSAEFEGIFEACHPEIINPV